MQSKPGRFQEAVAALARDCALGGASVVVRPASPGHGTNSAALDPERPIYPASMIKTPIALALSREVDEGRRCLGERVVVSNANLTLNDAPSPLAAGYRTTLGELADLMISRSDNVATNVLIDVLGREAITSACTSFGLRHTAVRRKLSGALPLIDDAGATGRNSHPAVDAAHAFELIAARHQRGSHWLYDALLAQIWNAKLARGWDVRDSFAHKTGDTDEQSHDGGILTLADGRSYVVVVYSELPSNAQTDDKFAAFARGLRRLLLSIP